jgi:hypothetical protein
MKIYPFRPKKWALFKVIQDIINYRNWIKTCIQERDNPKSLWNKFGMKHNLFYIIYMHINLANEYKMLPDNIKRLKVVETLAPVHRYLDEDLGFAGYIVPEFNQFVDEDNEPTLAYGIIYRFAFKRLSLKWIINRSIILGLLIWGFSKYEILNIIIEWIKQL